VRLRRPPGQARGDRRRRADDARTVLRAQDPLL
jgi:hypothetical protein